VVHDKQLRAINACRNLAFAYSFGKKLFAFESKREVVVKMNPLLKKTSWHRKTNIIL